MKNPMNDDADEFSEIVGADREKLFDVEYLKTLNFKQAIELSIKYMLSDKERDRFFQLYVNVAHADKTIEQLHEEIGIKSFQIV